MRGRREVRIKLLFLVLGLLCLGLGTVGVVVPLLPSTPFFLVAAFCFSKCSVRLHRWFQSTRLYKNYLDSFVTKRAMERKVKVSIMVGVTIMLTVGFVLMDGLVAGQTVLVAVWVLHLLYFTFRIKTVPHPVTKP